MLYLAGIIITFFLAIILWAKKGKTAGDKVMAAWLCVIGMHSFLFYLHITEEIYKYPYLLGLQLPLPLLQGPLLYLYVLTETRYNGFRKSYWLHFITTVIAFAALSEFFFYSDAEKIRVYRHGGEGFEWYTNAVLIALTVSGFVYVLLSLFELNRYKKRIADEYSNTEKINLNWLRYLIYGILVIWLIIAFRGDDRLIFGTVVVFVVLLGYFGITHVGVFTYQKTLQPLPIQAIPEGDLLTTEQSAVPVEMIEHEQIETYQDIPIRNPEERSAEPDGSKTKYERSALQHEAAEQIHAALTRLMQTEQIFKEAELSLAGLANRLDVHPNYLSQVINTYEHKNFYDYINTLRIEEFKKLVNIPENGRYTLLSLAFECGFNSKTSFNRNFKKITGLAPSDYLKQANIQLV